ncbi:RHS repeat-associated core domain-containing protein [Luteibacter yeojuensis]|jgi:RHS repeat-associated protein
MRRYIIGFGLLLFLGVASAQQKTVTYYYTDPQGTPLAEADASGNVVETVDYRPYGVESLGQSDGGPGYTGHVEDSDSGLVYMQARYYDPSIGRFLSTDPAHQEQGNVYDFNNFLYAKGNPLRYLDPDGRRYAEAWSKQGVAIGAGTVAVASIAVDAATGGINIVATPAEVAGGGIAGGFLGYQLGRAADHIMGTEEHPADANPAAPANDGNTNPYTGKVDAPVVVVDSKGNAIPVAPGQSVKTSPNGDFQQVIGSDGRPTGDRLDRGGHPKQSDPKAREPHGHRPGVTDADGNPHLPIN